MPPHTPTGVEDGTGNNQDQHRCFDPGQLLPIDELTEELVTQLEWPEPVAFAQVPTLTQSGVYALYYSPPPGTNVFAPYLPLAGTDQPIYIGKSASKGARTGQIDDGPERISVRLATHRNSIKAAANLSYRHFTVRWLEMDDDIALFAERRLIRHYQPLWNTETIAGFGNRTVGASRHNQARSAWDELHPGRRGAAKGPCRTARPELHAYIAQHLDKQTSLRTGRLLEAA